MCALVRNAFLGMELSGSICPKDLIARPSGENMSRVSSKGMVEGMKILIHFVLVSKFVTLVLGREGSTKRLMKKIFDFAAPTCSQTCKHFRLTRASALVSIIKIHGHV